MIYGLKPYPEYKDSGSRWLGPVPAHWEVLPLGRLMAQRIEKNDPIKTNDILSLSLHTGVIPYSEKKTGGNKAKDDLSAYILAYPGDIVLNSMNVVVGSVGLSKYFGAVSPVYYVLYPRAPDGSIKFFDAIFQDSTFQRSLFGLGNGIMVIQSRSTGKLNTIRMRIPMTSLRRVQLPHPGHDEQSSIVRFLDYANGRLERAIRAKRKVIALLHEQKQAIIHRAVTRGVDPTVPLKPSGIAWLGDIPEHWEVKRIKYLLREVDHRSTTGSETLLSMRMHHGLVVFAEHFSRPPQAATLVGFKIVRPGQFVVNRMQAGNGVIFASKLKLTGLVSPDYAVFDPIGNANVDFLGELFRSRKVRAKFRAESKGLGTGSSGFLRLYNDRLGAIHVALPPRDEQSGILRGLAEEHSGLNTAISRLEREIELLREYRTRLVADVVTGKLDVRPAARHLPADVEAMEATSVIEDTVTDEAEITEVESA